MSKRKKKNITYRSTHLLIGQVKTQIIPKIKMEIIHSLNQIYSIITKGTARFSKNKKEKALLDPFSFWPH